MSIKTILVPISGGSESRSALAAGFAVGRDFGAHVTVLHAKADPRDALPMLGDGMSGAMVRDLMTLAETEADRRATVARTLYDEFRTRHGIPEAGRPPGPGEVSAAWREVVGAQDDVVAHGARLFDLVVVGRSTSKSDEAGAAIATATLHSALFETGRPVLVAPPHASLAVGRRVVVAWNGSMEAARAVGAAMPFLLNAEQVTVVTAEPETADSGPDDLALHLAWHGIEVRTRQDLPIDVPTGYALLAACGEADADLLIMGAYTHSRFRELIMGGATLHVLEAAELPVLAVH